MKTLIAIVLLFSLCAMAQVPKTPEPGTKPAAIAIPAEFQLKLLKDQHQIDQIRVRAAAIAQWYQQQVGQLTNQENAAQKLYDTDQDAAYKAAKLEPEKFNANLDTGKFEPKPEAQKPVGPKPAEKKPAEKKK